jgi:hypothetical protein
MGNKLAVISPSGNFYGSEQTLYQYLLGTALSFDVFIKDEKNGLFDRLKLDNLNKHKLSKFKNARLLYFWIFFLLIFKYKSIYVNEGGHIRYIKLLARIFKKRNFFVHIRLTEDTHQERLKNLPNNIQLISVSSFIANLINRSIDIETVVLSSPLRGGDANAFWDYNMLNNEKIKIGVIGRVTPTKGLNNVKQFIAHLESIQNNKFEFHFFGTLEIEIYSVKEFVLFSENLEFVKCCFHGYNNDKRIMYSYSDLILHFNQNEPLGVVFFEALNYKTPFLGFDSGGIGEIAGVLNISQFVDQQNDWEAKLLYNIQNLNFSEFEKGLRIMHEIYSPAAYIKRLDTILTII